MATVVESIFTQEQQTRSPFKGVGAQELWVVIVLVESLVQTLERILLQSVSVIHGGLKFDGYSEYVKYKMAKGARKI